MSTIDNNFALHGLITHLINQGKNFFALLLISEGRLTSVIGIYCGSN